MCACVRVSRRWMMNDRWMDTFREVKGRNEGMRKRRNANEGMNDRNRSEKLGRRLREGETGR